MARTDYGAILSTVIKDTSDAIREVNGTSSLIAPNGWGSAIRTMHSDSDYDNVIDQLIEETATGDIASFSDGANNLPCEVTCTLNPVQAGSGVPSPDNVREILGFDSGVITRCGKNLFDKDNADVINAYIASNGTYTTSNPSTKSIYIKIKPNTTYTISKSASSGFSVGTTDHILQSGDVVSHRMVNYQGATSLTITSGASDKYLYAWVYTSGQDSGTLDEKLATVQIEESATTTTYEAYNGTTYTFAFGQTVYGASLDVGSGVLTIDKGYISFDGSENWVNVGGSYPFAFQIDTGITNKVDNPIASQGIICNLFPQATTDVPSSNAIRWQVGGSTGRLYVYDYTHSGDLTAFKQMLANEGLQVAYKLATPTTTQLTPQEVKSLLGSNNFYHDGNGKIQVVYKANGELYVQQHS